MAERIFSEFTVMTQSSSDLQSSISLTQDELRDKFVAEGWEATLKASCDLERTDPFMAGFDKWKNPIPVCREVYKDRQTGRRTALIYWSKDDQRIPTIMSLVDGQCTYRWGGIPATP